MSEKGPQSMTKKKDKTGGRRGCRRGGVAMVAVKGMGRGWGNDQNGVAKGISLGERGQQRV